MTKAQRTVRKVYPDAIAISSGASIWIQDNPAGVAVSYAYAVRMYGPHAANMAWLNAAKLVRIGQLTEIID